MADAARLVRGRGHTYRLDGRRVPSVTGITGILDKPALVGWAANVTAQYAIEHWDTLATLPALERYDEMKGARYAVNKRATVDGKRIHGMAEALQRSGDVEVPDDIRGQVEAVARFLDAWGFETVATEALVANTGSEYGGQADAYLRSPRLGTVLGDWKTGKGVYQDTALQLAGYLMCDLMLEEFDYLGPRGGKKIGFRELPTPEVDGCYIFHVLPDSVDLYPVRVDERERNAFLFCREVWDWKQLAQESKSDVYDPPVDEPVFPEQYPPDGTGVDQ